MCVKNPFPNVYSSVFPSLSKLVARLEINRLNPFSSLTSTTSGLRLSPAGYQYTVGYPATGELSTSFFGLDATIKD